MILGKILTLSLIATNLLIKINPVFANTNYPIWEEESGWITITRNSQEVMKIKKDSIKQNGKYKKVVFSKLFQRYNTDTQEYMKDDYTVIVGEGYFQCGVKYSKLNPANVNSVFFKNLKFFDSKEDLKLRKFDEIEDSLSWKFLSGKIDAIYHYVCKDMNPNYLKPGMSMFEVKKLLYNGGFKIVEIEEQLVNTYNSSLCDTPKHCQAHSMNGVIYVLFHNKKTGMYVSTGNVGNVLYSVSTYKK